MPHTQTVTCRKYGETLEALERPPFPNALGEKIQATVSKKAWQEWISHQTMLINENHLSLQDPKAKAFLSEQREKFLDNADYERPQGWTPED